MIKFTALALLSCSLFADDWPGKFAPIPWVFAEIVRRLHLGEVRERTATARM